MKKREDILDNVFLLPFCHFIIIVLERLSLFSSFRHVLSEVRTVTACSYIAISVLFFHIILYYFVCFRQILNDNLVG